MKFKKEILKRAALSSRTLREFLKKINASETSMSSRAWVKKRCREYGIDLSHFIIPRGRINVVNKATAKEILVYDRRNGLRERTYVLRRALKESGVKEKCKCGQGTKWRGEKLTLEIDHIDGNPLNNLKNNLRFICPNCHSQKKIDYKKNKK